MKDNWNIFVGDERYKTNFFLKFVDKGTESLYSRSLIPSSRYSIRLLILVIALIEAYLSYSSVVMIILIVTMCLIASFGISRFSDTRSLHLQQFCSVITQIFQTFTLVDNANLLELQNP